MPLFRLTSRENLPKTHPRNLCVNPFTNPILYAVELAQKLTVKKNLMLVFMDNL